MTSRSKLVLGGPGCGKTTYLLKLVDEYLASGGTPTRVAYVSFTRRAIREARERAMRHLDIEDLEVDDPLPYFRTIHSIATRLRQRKTKKFLTRSRFLQWCEDVDIDKGSRLMYRGTHSVPDFTKPTSDDMALFASNYARLMRQPLDEVVLKLGSSYQQAYRRDREYRELLDEGFIDYTSVLEEYITAGDQPVLDLLIVDEAQDLSALQWQVIDKLAENANEVIYAGDDDQAIYEWSGADVDHFVSLRDTCEKVILPKSHRLPYAVWEECVAYAKRGIHNRIEKQFDAHTSGGTVDRLNLNELNRVAQSCHPVLPSFQTGETWFLLARTNHFLNVYRAILRTHGVPYIENDISSVNNKTVELIRAYMTLQEGGTIDGKLAMRLRELLRPDIQLPDHMLLLENNYADRVLARTDVSWYDALDLLGKDRTYYSQVLDTYGSFDIEPKVTVGTIHSVKGGEADNVVVSRKISRKIELAATKNPDVEPRVFYVAMSRARKRLLYLIHDNGTEFRV